MLENNRHVEFGLNGRKYAERHHDIIKITAECKAVFDRLVKNR